MSQLNILLGAGFSYGAGLPLVQDFNRDFNRDITEQLLNSTSGEWSWRDTAEQAEVHNGSLTAEHFIYGFAFQEVLREFGTVSNYEDLYDFLISQGTGFYHTCFDRARVKCQAALHINDDNAVMTSLSWQAYDKLVVAFNCLIIDRLLIKKNAGDLLDYYKHFFQFIGAYDQVRIFSLNHDLLIEQLLELQHIVYSDGFSANNSMLMGAGNVPQRIFQDDFSAALRFYKLHGSAGMYGFKVADQMGNALYPTGEVVYFKADSYQSKHNAIRKDPITGEIAQTFNIDVSPKFITGKNKDGLINGDPMYSRLFKRFKEENAKGDSLLVVGYSYRDDHVNEIISTGKFASVVNINPSQIYNFNNAEKIIHLKSIQELAGLEL